MIWNFLWSSSPNFFFWYWLNSNDLTNSTLTSSIWLWADVTNVRLWLVHLSAGKYTAPGIPSAESSGKIRWKPSDLGWEKCWRKLFSDSLENVYLQMIGVSCLLIRPALSNILVPSDLWLVVRWCEYLDSVWQVKRSLKRFPGSMLGNWSVSPSRTTFLKREFCCITWIKRAKS